jgi:hypothetical protein
MASGKYTSGRAASFGSSVDTLHDATPRSMGPTSGGAGEDAAAPAGGDARAPGDRPIASIVDAGFIERTKGDASINPCDIERTKGDASVVAGDIERTKG